MSVLRNDSRAATALAGCLLAATLTAALVVRLAWADEARRQLAYPFGHLPARPDTGLSIFATNARLLGALLLSVVLVRSRWLAVPKAARGLAAITVLSALDTLVVLTVALNTFVVGSALGAYGRRMAAAVLPHGPVELAAFALALALYVRARRQPVPAGEVLAVAAASLTGLAVAAALETFVVL